MIGRTLSHYEILEEISRGGMGIVYKALDVKLNREVALKVLPPEVVSDSERKRRFVREAQAAAALKHPNIAVVYEIDEAEGVTFIAMELVEGEELSDVLQGKGLPVSRVLELTHDIAQGLAQAHEKGVVHRDLKPANILLTADGHAKIIDFGLAKLIEPIGTASGEAETAVRRETQSGTVMGTFSYMSPEQARGQTVDHRSDIFSFGIVLYEMLVGEAPFKGATSADTLGAILKDPAPRLVTSNVAAADRPPLQAILDKCLAKEPADRYGTFEEVLTDVRRLREGSSGSAAATEAVAPADAQLGVRRTPFVGRAAERAELDRLVDQAIRGRGGMILIGGEPGVGKTRLVEQVLDSAERRQCLTLTGRCYEIEGTPPFMPFVETLELCTRLMPPAVLRQALGDAAPEVARLAPDLRRLFPEIPPPLELPPEQQRHYLFKNFSEFLERASRVSSLVVLLDDLQWADDATLHLLQHLALQLGQMPVLVLGTYRDVELDVHRPFAKTLETLTRKRLAQRLNLQRLSQEDVSEMLAALGGPSPPEPLVEGVYRETEGNPFFIEEVFQHLEEEGALFGEDGLWRTDLDLESLDVPEGVRLVIGRRLERVSQESQKVLTFGAIVGRSFSLTLLEAIGEVTGDALLTALEEAEESHLIVPTSGREARWEFAHALIRQTLVGNLSLPRRQRLHLTLAEAIERAAGASANDHASDLAHHLYQAGAAADPMKTVRFMTVAGERGLETGAFEESLRHFDNALSLPGDLGPSVRASLLFMRGRALHSLGRTKQTLTDWQEAAEIYERLGDVEALARTCWAIAWECAYRAENEKAIPIARRGLAIVGDRPSVTRCRLLAAAALSLANHGDCEAAPSLMSEAVAMAEQVGGPELLAEVLGVKPLYHWPFMQSRELVEAGRRASELLQSQGNLSEWLRAEGMSKLGRLFIGDLVGAADVEECETVANRLGDQGTQVVLRVNRGLRELMQTGDLDRFEKSASWYRDFNESVGYPWTLVAHSHLGLVHFWRGSWGKAREHFEISLRVERERPSAYFVWGNFFMALAYAGDSRALRLLEQHPSALPRPGPLNAIGSWITLMRVIEGLAVLGDREKAAKLYPSAVDAIETGTVVEWHSTTLPQIPAGIAAAASEQWDAAEDHYQTALREAHELPHKIAQPEARRWYARMLIDRSAPGDREKASILLGEAMEMYRQIGMPKHVEMTEAISRES